VLVPTLKVLAIGIIVCLGLVGIALISTTPTAGRPTTSPVSIDTAAQLNNERTGPVYVPAIFTPPANSTVIMTVDDFDNATPSPPNTPQPLASTAR